MVQKFTAFVVHVLKPNSLENRGIVCGRCAMKHVVVESRRLTAVMRRHRPAAALELDPE